MGVFRDEDATGDMCCPELFEGLDVDLPFRDMIGEESRCEEDV